MPVQTNKAISSPLIEKVDQDYHFHYDILGLTFWMLNRIEELAAKKLDSHERFSALSSHAFQNNYLERPIVDEWLYILRQVIKKCWPQISLKQNSFSMKVSHDVDSPSMHGFRSIKNLIRGMAGDIIKRKDPYSAILAPWIRLTTTKKLHKRDSFNTFDWIMKESEKNNLCSAFYFITGITDPDKDADYKMDHPAIQNLLKEVHSRNHEIGLHPSYNSFKKPDVITKEANTLKEQCKHLGIEQEHWGGRMHYLRWEHPTTMLAWEKANMTYDSTL